MSDLVDKLHDLAHHAYDAVTGALSDPAKPTKYSTPPGQPNTGTGIAAAGQDAITNYNKTLNDKIDEMSK